MSESVLTLSNYGVQEDGKVIKARVTLAPHMIQVVIAGEETQFVMEGREIKKVNVLLLDGNNIELLISEVDLISLERAIGTYILP